MQKKRVAALKEAWGAKPCSHPSLAKEYDLGKRTGNYVCTQCGTTLTFREKLELQGPKAPPQQPSHSGGYMSKKSSRAIPDFSRKASRPKAPGAPAAPAAPGASLPPKANTVIHQPPRPKPQATSSKSGQRGK